MDSRKNTQNMPFFLLTHEEKRMSTILENISVGSDKTRILHSKGAAELILASCSQIHLMNENKVVSITPEQRASIEDTLKKIEGRAHRAICIAYKDLSGHEDLKAADEHGVYSIEREGLILLGILEVGDVLREGVPEAVSRCKQAGINVIMVTGDNKLSSTIIAKECGILNNASGDEENSVLEGVEFELKAEGTGHGNMQAFMRIARKLRVLARVRPEDKLLLVAGLQKLGHVVAVTGAGSADAPALKQADVGIAMAINGTEVARETSDVIILDDNFCSILNGVLWGRNIQASIKKYIQFLITMNLVIVVLTFFGSIFYGIAILTPVQLLWINLAMGIIVSLAFGAEPPHPQLLQEPASDKIFSEDVVKFIITHSAYQLIVIIILVCLGERFIPEQSDLLDPRDIYTNAAAGTQTQARFSPYGDGQYVISGRMYHIDATYEYYPI